eukprot:g2291.t1
MELLSRTPLLRTLHALVVAPGYPGAIQLPHDVWGVVAFRSSYSTAAWRDLSWSHRLVGGYFSYCFGGTTMRDLLLGQPPSLISSPTVPLYWFLGYLLACHAPGDLVYDAVRSKGHPVRVGMSVMEAMDSATTLCSSFERGMEIKGASPAGPLVVAVVAALGGSMFRYLERRGRGEHDLKTEWARPTGSLQRAVAYVAAYALLRRLYGVRTARVAVVFFHMVMSAASEAVGRDVNPAAPALDSALRLSGLG